MTATRTETIEAEGPYGGRAAYKTATILSGAALSDVLLLGPLRPCRIIMPAAWTAANLTVQTSYDNGVTFNDLYDASGTEYTITAAASRAILLPIADFLGVNALKLRSGTTGTPVNQGADRALLLFLVP